jgi:hypothetical protein
MKDINIVVAQLYAESKSVAPDPQKKNITPRPPTKKVRVQLEEERGEFFFRTSEMPTSVVEVCVQSYFASMMDPSRIGLNITSSDDSEEVEEEGIGSLSDEDFQIIKDSNRVIKEGTSVVTKDLVNLEKKLHNIMKDINHSAKQSADFQEKSLKLSKAVRYWPMFRISVLLIGGFFQVSHVIGYMKRHHVF